MIKLRAVDVAQPDILYLGGIARTLRVSSMAARAGMPVTPHCANRSLVTLFAMHLLRAIPNAGPYLEFSIEGADYYHWRYGLFGMIPMKSRMGARGFRKSRAGAWRSTPNGSRDRNTRSARPGEAIGGGRCGT